MATAFDIDVGVSGTVTGLVYRASSGTASAATVLLAHGAGASQRSPFMVAFAEGLSARGVDAVTFDFVYMARGRRAPDPKTRLESCCRAAIETTRTLIPSARNRLVVGGKSMGGRIASQVVAADDQDLGVAGLVFLGYPLHPPGRPDKRRDVHLGQVSAPMLFVQGTRDPFGTETEMAEVVAGQPGARLSVVANGDHSLVVRGRDAPTPAMTYATVQDTMVSWIGDL